MNLYLALGLAILIALACAASGYEGDLIGKDTQSVADQAKFDRFNQQIASQKIQAAAILADANAANLKLATDRDALKTQLEKAHAAATIATNSLHTQLAGSVLRFAADKDSGCRGSGSSTTATGTDAASSAAPITIQLPRKIQEDLDALMLEADQQRDAYALCYGWAQSVK